MEEHGRKDGDYRKSHQCRIGTDKGVYEVGGGQRVGGEKVIAVALFCKASISMRNARQLSTMIATVATGNNLQRKLSLNRNIKISGAACRVRLSCGLLILAKH